MGIHFNIFFQGLPFIVLITFLFVTKKSIKGVVWFYLSFPTILYFILIKFGSRFFSNEYGEYFLLSHIILVNIAFTIWLFYLMQKDYTMEVLEDIVEKKYLKKIKQKEFQYYQVSEEILYKLIEKITNEMWYVYIPESKKIFLVKYEVSRLYMGRKFIDKLNIFLEKKVEKGELEEEFAKNIFYKLYEKTRHFIVDNDLIFHWEFYTNEIFEKVLKML